MSNKLELETSAGKTIQAYKDQAKIAGLALRLPVGTDYGGYPERIYDSLQRFRRNIAITRDHKKIVKTMARQLVTTKDEKGRPTRKEYLTYQGYYSGLTHKREEYQANFEIGKYKRPKIVPNSDIRYDPRTGDPIGSEKALGTAETIYEIEVPKSKEARKKLIDSILGEDNYPDNVLYYVRHLNESNYENSRDNSFGYQEFVNLDFEDLVATSQKGTGSKSSPYYTDNEGQL